MKRICLSICFITFLLSCNSDDDSQNQDQNQQEEESPGFYALEVGNSWTYKSFQYNLTEDAYYETDIQDAVSITGKEEISGNTYFVFRTETTGNNDPENPVSNPNGIKFEYLRELEGDLVNETNDIVFTSTDYTEQIVYETSWGIVYDKLATDLATVEVPAGTFQSYDKERYAKSPEGDLFPALDHIYYSEGIGLISDSMSFVSQDKPFIVRRLSSYLVQ
ncbi:hypothetical protein [Bizionia arctica]|uniref:Uncharacterized protein n=1 Tax=Bizionia arctica TaxID=1495645 RepID=A0A917GEZ1_9FLAO|nr:hypothetical protein [Bizionia arctica]GGG41941.1 hypothetical protein GCM10010976_11850 [Bizionia arctica]